MNALSKVQASLVSGTQETTLALANLNFDFSLVKVEAPVEYRQLGVALARKRRSAAEIGKAHITARRLGSLFQSILPDTPKLIRAYGLRASEIAQSPEANPRGSKDDGPFQDYIGVDGTTIWAAATSSSAAIAAHLLACMLATHWPTDKAVAIWVELVNERKRRLDETIAESHSFRLDDAVATQMSLDQEQLAMWDSSARAWLKAAEDAPVVKSRQKTLRSFLIDVTATVSSQQDLYTSVTEAWRLALSTLEAIIGGASYDVSDGSVILALLSWHLYPDIITVATKPQTILQEDDLVPGGQVIIGLTRQDQSSFGVHWCLSLGHLSYYGASQRITQSMSIGDPQHNRLTLSDFILVLLGGIVGQWSSEEYIGTSQALEIITLAISTAKKGFDAHDDRPANVKTSTVFVHFADALSRFSNRNEIHDDLPTKLVELGVRYKDFFKPRKHHGLPLSRLPLSRPPSGERASWLFCLFGMNNLHFGAAFTHQEDRLQYSRSLSRKMLESAQNPSTPKPCFLLVFNHGDDKERKAFFYWARVAENLGTITTEVPVKLNTYKLLKPGLKFPGGGISPSSTLLWELPPSPIRDLLVHCSVARNERKQRHELGHGWIFDCKLQSVDEEILLFGGRIKTQRFDRRRHYTYDSDDEDQDWTPIMTISNSTEHVLSYLRSGKLCPIRFCSLFCTTNFYTTYLAPLSIFFRLYEGLAGAKISPDILKCRTSFWDIVCDDVDISRPLPLESTLILPPDGATTLPQKQERTGQLRFESSTPPRESVLSGRLDRDRLQHCFKLIATFEVGRDLLLAGSERLLGQVFAISIDDSLYIASPLLDDPTSGFQSPPEIRRIRGNIGRPGLNFLGFFSSRDAVRVRQRDPGMWKVVNHHEYDGELEDCFSATTLHLSLTGYVHDVALQGGSRFSSISFAEAVVSAHEAGHWVADLDILNARLIRGLILITARKECPGSCEVGKIPQERLLAIENWEELLDPPRAAAVFQAHGNWQARLAAVLICLQKGYLTLLFGSHGCWDCTFEHLSAADPKSKLSAPLPLLQSSGLAGPEKLDSSHSGTTQGIGIPSEGRDIPTPEPLKEGSIFSLDGPDSEAQQAEDSDILSEESAEEEKSSYGLNSSSDEGQSDRGLFETGANESEWPQDSGPRPIVFIL